MDADDEFGCLGIPTPVEMWKQHAILLTAEIEELTVENRKARQNIAKLVEMHSQVAAELALASKRLSECYLSCSNLGNKVNSLTMSSEKAHLYFDQKCTAEKALFELRKRIEANLSSPPTVDSESH
ncbi:MAG: hypothetical protein JWR17_3969 [Pseudomonas sp.]|uniref:hypothetical protein n=1 Tax=Pseudomonas sp. TaxID=306 RepID=UPI00261FEDCE|nr:hypothetical protein [Pseudomonas sp.]MDB6051223.1 hypothetical protein [Pseudomonas sp.]